MATSNNPNRESYEKNCSETRSEAETGRFYVKLLMFICTSSYAYAPLTQPRSFLAGTLLSLLLDIDTSRSIFLYRFLFQRPNKSKATNFTKHKRNVCTTELLNYCTYCHTYVLSHFISLFYYRQL